MKNKSQLFYKAAYKEPQHRGSGQVTGAGFTQETFGTPPSETKTKLDLPTQLQQDAGNPGIRVYHEGGGGVSVEAFLPPWAPTAQGGSL